MEGTTQHKDITQRGSEQNRDDSDDPAKTQEGHHVAKQGVSGMAMHLVIWKGPADPRVQKIRGMLARQLLSVCTYTLLQLRNQSLSRDMLFAAVFNLSKFKSYVPL